MCPYFWHWLMVPVLGILAVGAPWGLPTSLHPIPASPGGPLTLATAFERGGWGMYADQFLYMDLSYFTSTECFLIIYDDTYSAAVRWHKF